MAICLDFDWQTNEFMLYCRTTQLREKTILSYEQTLRLFEKWCKEEQGISTVDKVNENVIRRYIFDLQERGKYGQTIFFADRNSRPSSIWAYAHRHDGVGATALVILAMVLDPSLTEDTGLAVLRRALDTPEDVTVYNGLRYAFTGTSDFFFLDVTIEP